MSVKERIEFLPCGADPLQAIAAQLLQQTTDPDFSAAVILLPRAPAALRLSQQLLRGAEARGQDAILLPWMGTLEQWLARQCEQPLMGALERELRLYETVRARPALCQAADPWPLTESLLALFDTLAVSRHGAAEHFSGFARQLAQAYGTGQRLPRALAEEAEAVHTLWRAWREQARAAARADPVEALAEMMWRGEGVPAATRAVHVAGYTRFSDAQLAWLQALLANPRARLWLHGSTAEHADNAPLRSLAEALGRVPPPARADPRAELLDCAFGAGTGELNARARTCAEHWPAGPLDGDLRVVVAGDAEQEAQHIDVQMRRWWHAGHSRLAMVTNDRRLARRVRALLERSHLPVTETGGWRMSTTSAASALLDWLTIVSAREGARALVALLAGPFAGDTLALSRCLRRAALRRRADAPLDHAQRQLETEREALVRRYGLDTVVALDAQLAAIHRCRERWQAGGEQRTLSHWLAALRGALHEPGIARGLAADDAGAVILELLEEMTDAVPDTTVRLPVGEFRTWLKRVLEGRNFHPPRAAGRHIALLSLADSRALHFDALVIGACTATHLPRTAAHAPFFNDAVRAQLALPTSLRERQEQFLDFRRLLEAAPRIVLSTRREEQGVSIMPSPWLARLQTFQRLGWPEHAPSPGPQALPARLRPRIAAPAPLPVRTTRPHPRLPAARAPRQISATMHQRLLDCPYRYFARDGLGLRGPRSEEFSAADYGSRVHRILRAFHADVAGLPGPFPDLVEPGSHAAAAALLHQISDAVFAPDVAADRFTAGWLYQWRLHITPYLEWLQARTDEGWRIRDTELALETPWQDGFSLVGRLDRLEQRAGEQAIVDYKTGQPARGDDILHGEDGQLAFYALLVPAPVEQAALLVLRGGGVRDRAQLSGPALAQLRQNTATRLNVLCTALQQGVRLPAWGVEADCRRCDFPGLCRREVWSSKKGGHHGRPEPS